MSEKRRYEFKFESGILTSFSRKLSNSQTVKLILLANFIWLGELVSFTVGQLDSLTVIQFLLMAEEPSFELADFRLPQQDNIYDRQN